MKRCGKCCIEKNESEFGKSKARKDGLSNRCKSCKSIEHKEYILKYPEKFKEKYSKKLPEWREKNKEKLKEYSKKDRERKKENCRKPAKSLEEVNTLKEIALKNQSEWKSKSQERKREYKKKYRTRKESKTKDKSRKLLQYAVVSGKIRRPEKCEKCGIECKPDGHHTDYSKPLYVIWLCHVCHSHEHGELLDVKP